MAAHESEEQKWHAAFELDLSDWAAFFGGEFGWRTMVWLCFRDNNNTRDCAMRSFVSLCQCPGENLPSGLRWPVTYLRRPLVGSMALVPCGALALIGWTRFPG